MQQKSIIKTRFVGLYNISLQLINENSWQDGRNQGELYSASSSCSKAFVALVSCTVAALGFLKKMHKKNFNI